MAGRSSKIQQAINVLKMKIELAVRDVAVAQAEVNTMMKLRADLEAVRDAKPKAQRKPRIISEPQKETA